MPFFHSRFSVSKRQVLVGSAFALLSAPALMNSNPPLNGRQKAILWGNILGDGHLQLSPNEKAVRLRFDHSSKQADYVTWQFRELGWLCQGVSAPKVIPEREFFKCRAYTKYTPILKPYHDVTYTKSTKPKRRFEKILPENLGDYVTDPEMLMVWYLDDGTLRRDSGACRLATQGFSLAEHEILQNVLQDNFGIESVIEKWPKGKSGLYVPKRNAAKFVHLFSSTVIKEIPSMKYKLDLYL